MEQLFAYQRILNLPLPLAVVLAAEQNFRLDMQRGLVKGPHRWQYDKYQYTNEVVDLFIEQQSNYFPGDDNAEPWIHTKVKLRKDNVLVVSNDLSSDLLRMFDIYYERMSKKEEVGFKPLRPTTETTPQTVVDYCHQVCAATFCC